MVLGMFKLRGPFGERIVGVVGGRASTRDVDEFLGKLAKADRKNRTTSQAFDASSIAGKGHLVHAARLALVAHATKKNFASSLNIELVCWVAAERQIARAFKKVGLRESSKELAILTLGDSRARIRHALANICRGLGIERDDGVLELTREKVGSLRKVFSISEDELKIAPLQKLVLERVALLALER
jgi:tRNA threonylcarbamoyladenosine modification (KEOPS) complex Cgi121 subunit